MHGREMNQGGFTLLEGFVVLAIVVLLTAVSIPAIINTLAHQKLANATDSFVNQVEFARVQAAATNRAYQLRVVLSDGNNSGATHLDEGASSSCTRDSFDTAKFDSEGAHPTMYVRKVLYDGEWDGTVHIESVSPASLAGTAQVPAGEPASVGVCFKPDGRVLRLDTGQPIEPEEGSGYAAGEAIFLLRLYEGSDKLEPSNRTRTVVVPYNGIPKVR